MKTVKSKRQGLGLAKLLTLLVWAKTLLITVWAYPQLSDRMITHWGVDGRPNGWMEKGVGAWFGFGVETVILLMAWILPRVVPKAKFHQSEKIFEWTILVLMIFMLWINALVLVVNLGYVIDMNRMISLPLAGLFGFFGAVLPKMQPNWVMGVRTPWTMSNKRVWAKTHNLAGKLFFLMAVTTATGWFYPQLAFYLMIIPLIFVVVFLLVYSCWAYRCEVN